MSTFFNLPFGVRIAGSDPIDKDRYIASGTTHRDSLIGSGREFNGLQVYVESDQTLYILKDKSAPTWEAVSSSAIATSSPFSGNSITGSISPLSGNNISTGAFSFIAGGQDNISSGDYSHAEGDNNIASGTNSHVEGSGNLASGTRSHAEGFLTTASGTNSHSEGSDTTASGTRSHSEGDGTTASGSRSHTEGSNTIADGRDSHAEGDTAQALGDTSHAEGFFTVASGEASHAEGNGSTASGNYSHAEGDYSISSGEASHAEGKTTTAIGDRSHTEGLSTTASGDNSHAEGNFTIATGITSHAQGFNTKAFGFTSHAQGFSTTAIGTQSHAEGNNTTAFGTASHSEGTSTVASGNTSHAGGNASRAIAQNSFVHSKTSDVEAEDGAILGGELNKLTSTANRSIILGGLGITGSTADTVYGVNFNASGQILSGGTDLGDIFGAGSSSSSPFSGNTITGSILPISGDNISTGEFSFVAGSGNIASGNYGSSAIGWNNESTGPASNASGYRTTGSGLVSFAQGWETLSLGSASHSEGRKTTASADFSHAEGYGSIASGTRSHAEGNETISSGNNSHAEGFETTSSGNFSHAEGASTSSLGDGSHAEGNATVSSGFVSHAEGFGTISSGFASHSEGGVLGNPSTIASGGVSHAEGDATTAAGRASHAGGEYSIASGRTSFAHSSKSTVSSNFSTILGGRNNLLTSSATGSTILGGLGITGTSENTVYGVNFNASGNISGSSFFIGSTNLNSALDQKLDKSGGTVTGNIVITGDVEILGTATTINTETVRSLDNNIDLNYSGTHLSAIGGGLTLISGKTDGSSSTILSNNVGDWISNVGVGALNISGGTLYSGNTDLSDIFLTSLAINDGNGTTWNSGTTSVDLGGAYTSPIDIAGNTIGVGVNITSSNSAGDISSINVNNNFLRSIFNLSALESDGSGFVMGAGSNSELNYGYYNASGLTSVMGISPTSMYIADQVNSTGLKYIDDYSTLGTTDPLWIPNWGAVRNLVTGTTSGITTTINNGNGTIWNTGTTSVDIGGSLLNTSTSIDLDGSQDFSIILTENISFPPELRKTTIKVDNNGIDLLLSSDDGTVSGFNIAKTINSFGYTNGSSSTAYISTGQDGIKIVELIEKKGIEYIGDSVDNVLWETDDNYIPSIGLIKDNQSIARFKNITAGDSLSAMTSGHVYTINISSGVTFSLPSNPNSGQEFIIKDASGLASTNNIIINVAGNTYTIDGSAQEVLENNYESARYMFNGIEYLNL